MVSVANAKSVKKPAFLNRAMLTSETPDVSIEALNDYAARNILPELQRLPGVGSVTQFGSERAMRIWIDPAKLKGFNLSLGQVSSAISSQNLQVSAGNLGELPSTKGQTTTATIVVRGQLSTAEQFGDIVLRANTDGSIVRLRDVARIELGAQTYSMEGRLNGKPAAVLALYQMPGANALESAAGAKKLMAELKESFPPDLDYVIALDRHHQGRH